MAQKSLKKEIYSTGKFFQNRRELKEEGLGPSAFFCFAVNCDALFPPMCPPREA